jgi:hypothetical protein
MMTDAELLQAREIAKRWKSEEKGPFALVGGIGLLIDALLERGDYFEQLARERAASIETLHGNLKYDRDRADKLSAALDAWQRGLGPQVGRMDIRRKKT